MLGAAAAVFLAFAPPYLVERITEYMFLTSNPNFFTWSGLRLELFISSILVGAIVAAYLLNRLLLTVAAYTSGIVVLDL